MTRKKRKSTRCAPPRVGRPSKQKGYRTKQFVDWLAARPGAFIADIAEAGHYAIVAGSMGGELIKDGVIYRTREMNPATGDEAWRYHVTGVPYVPASKRKRPKTKRPAPPKKTRAELRRAHIKACITVLTKYGFRILPPERPIQATKEPTP
jgi:hypothetical protein